MKNYGLTLTAVANMTSNYGESLGNISSVQKIFKNGKSYAIRTRESLKNAIMVQSGMYDDLEVIVSGATQKKVTPEKNASNCRALEGGYMNTDGSTYVRNSSFYLTDAIAVQEFVIESRFHNNLHLAKTYAKANNINLQEKAGEAGLMPYQYEYDKAMKVYSLTIDMDMVGKDDNFEGIEASAQEKVDRVNSLLTAIEELTLVVKGNMDNSEPLFVVGGLGKRKTHYFENVVKVKEGKLVISPELKSRVEKGYRSGLLDGDNFNNEEQIKQELNALAVSDFFNKLREEVVAYFCE